MYRCNCVSLHHQHQGRLEIQQHFRIDLESENGEDLRCRTLCPESIKVLEPEKHPEPVVSYSRLLDPLQLDSTAHLRCSESRKRIQSLAPRTLPPDHDA